LIKESEKLVGLGKLTETDIQTAFDPLLKGLIEVFNEMVEALVAKVRWHPFPCPHSNDIKDKQTIDGDVAIVVRRSTSLQ